MNSIGYKVLSITFIFVLGWSAVTAQTAEILGAQAQINKVLEDSGKHFKDGMAAMKAGHKSESGEKFDRSVETFLLSTINIQRDAKLQACYAQLIETVYRLEFPSDAQPPQFRALSATCGWKWNEGDLKLADEVAQLVKPVKKVPNTDTVSHCRRRAGTGHVDDRVRATWWG